jgi:hypothetical protein
MGIMESVEALLSQQYKPQRTIYIAFGHDEEIQGFEGAQHIAQHLLVRLLLSPLLLLLSPLSSLLPNRFPTSQLTIFRKKKSLSSISSMREW